MSQAQPNQQTQLSFNTYRLPITLIGDIHQYLSSQPAAQTRNMLNAIDAALLADEKAQHAARNQESNPEKQVKEIPDANISDGAQVSS